MSETESLYTLTEAAKKSAVSRSYLYSLVKAGVLKSVMYDDVIYVSEGELNRLTIINNPKISDMVGHLFSYARKTVRFMSDSEKSELRHILDSGV